MALPRDRVEATYARVRSAMDANDWDAFVDQFAEDATFVNSVLPEPIRGREALRAFARHWPRVVNRPEWMVIEGNRLAVGWNERQETMPPEMPPYRGISTFEFDDAGRVRAYEGIFDTATLPGR